MGVGDLARRLGGQAFYAFQLGETWTRAVRRASRELPMAASRAVTQVPMLAPKTRAIPCSSEISPWLASMMMTPVVAEELCTTAVKTALKDETGEDDGQGVVGDLEGDDLGGDRGTDGGAHDDGDGLLQLHQAGRDEAHHQYRGHRGGLDDGGGDGAGEHPLEAVGGHARQQFLQPLTAARLEGVGHQLHAVEEDGQAAGQPHENGADFQGVFHSEEVRFTAWERAYSSVQRDRASMIFFA